MTKNKGNDGSKLNPDQFMHGVAIDAVIFGFHERQLKVLILKYRNTGLYALPGGFVGIREDLNQAALRVVRDRTGLREIYLEQFYCFGDYSRFDNKPMKAILLANGENPGKDHWLLQRFISVGYYALVDFTRAIPSPDSISDSCEWYELNEVPPLIQDHLKIILTALENLRSQLDKKLIGFKLLPDQFTMSDLQAVYETILGRNLLRPVFQRKLLGLGILKRMAKKKTGKAHKSPYLYRFVAERKRQKHQR